MVLSKEIRKEIEPKPRDSLCCGGWEHEMTIENNSYKNNFALIKNIKKTVMQQRERPQSHGT